jgi:hypothetical protein
MIITSALLAKTQAVSPALTLEVESAEAATQRARLPRTATVST